MRDRRLSIALMLALGASGCAARHVRDAEKARIPPTRTWFARQRASLDPAVLRRASAVTMNRAPGSWNLAGPANVGGRLTCIAVDPNDPNHVWAGAAAGGVFESADAGTTWTPVFDAQPVLSIGALAAHPTDSSVVYVGAGEANGAGYSYDGDGVYKTTDGGETWQHLGLDDTRRIGRIAIDPVNPQRVFVAAAGNIYTPDASRGVYRSIDGGASWTKVLFVAETAGAIDVVIDPSNPSRVYAAIWEHHSTADHWTAGGVNSGIWRSLDGGDTWTRLATGLPAAAADVGRIGLALAASSPQTLYALYLDDPGHFVGVYKTTNGGTSWSKVTGSGAKQAFSSYGYYMGQIRVDPSDANAVYLLDVFWARSTNGGQSFAVFTSGDYADHHDFVILPGRIYQANDAGFYRSFDGGATWTKAAYLPATQFYDLGIDPVSPIRRYGGTQDNGSIRAVDLTGNWYIFGGGDGFHCEVDPVDPSRVYFESQFGSIRRSTDFGNTSLEAVRGIPVNERTNWSTPIVHDPSVSQRLYAGSFRVFRSTDGASNWSAISGDLTDGPTHFADLANSHLENVVEGTVTTIAPSPLSVNVVWAGTDDGHVWVTQNGGGAWTRVDVPGRTEWVTRVEADPHVVGAAYVTYSGYRIDSPLPRIFRTVNFGASWTDIAGNLPDVPLNGVNADPDPAMRGRLFVASDLGVYVTSDYGLTWSALGTGMPPVVVLDLDLISSTRQLFAGTHGRSAYVYELSQLGPADADGDGSDNVADCRPDDATVFAAPGEIAGAAFAADKATLSWDAAAVGSATTYQVVRDGTCVAPGVSSPSIVDAAVPPSGSLFTYLVRATNVCGTGTYGATSDGVPRTGTCP